MSEPFADAATAMYRTGIASLDVGCVGIYDHQITRGRFKDPSARALTCLDVAVRALRGDDNASIKWSADEAALRS